MTRDEIIKMAREADLHVFGGDVIEGLERFCRMAQAAEREACALKAEEFLTEPEPDWDGDFWNQAIERVALAIRARGQQ